MQVLTGALWRLWEEQLVGGKRWNLGHPGGGNVVETVRTGQIEGNAEDGAGRWDVKAREGLRTRPGLGALETGSET